MKVGTGEAPKPDLTREQYEALSDEEKKNFRGIVGPKIYPPSRIKDKKKADRKREKKSRQKNRGKK